MGLPVDINPLTLGGTGYNINNSLRFRSSASAYLSRTPASAGNRQIWTYSAWVKRGQLGTYQGILAATAGTPVSFGFYNSDQFYMTVSGVGTGTTTAVFRDPSSWYHIVIKFDTTQATTANRVLIYINGVNYALSTTLVSQNTNYEINNNTAQNIGTTGVGGSTTYTDGYMAEVNFIDGQALTPSSFGAYNSYGVWAPTKYSGTYGTNGFYLNFNSYGSTAALGTDSSGNGNTWTVNNLSVTAGTTYDPMTDVPTLSSATASNYCVLNPLENSSVATYSSPTMSEVNLRMSTADTNQRYAKSSFYFTTGKYYFEATVASASSSVAHYLAFWDGSSVGSLPIYFLDGSTSGVTPSTAGSSITTGDVLGVAVDFSGTIQYYKNGVAGISRTFTPTSKMGIYLSVGGIAGGSWQVNFGQRPFSYTAPAGYLQMNTFNLPAPTIPIGASYMAATTYAGTAATTAFTNTVNGTGLKPDFIWFKDRTTATNHWLINSVTNTWLYSNLTNAEDTNSQLNSFDSNGFTLGTNNIALNASANNYVAWQWKAGGATAVTNTNGSISSQVSASQAAGFSVVTYTGTGANATVGHGLGATPAMIFVKNRNNVGGTTAGFCVGHTSIWPNGYLNLWNANATGSASTVWNTSPTSTVFGVGTDLGTNYSGASYLAYCWAAIPGFSAFGYYSGNTSSDGPFVYCGFRPRFILIKGSGIATVWVMFDTSRSTYNATGLYLCPGLTQAESGPGVIDIDVVSNGFKLRNLDGAMNTGYNYLYAAFAETPFKYALAR